MNIDRSFPRHPLPRPSDEVSATAVEVRDIFRSLAESLNAMLPESREKALALTHLEDSSTYAVKAIYADSVTMAKKEL